jgi:methyl-accepting chemotaxis protein
VGDQTFTTSASYIKDEKGDNVGHIEVVDNITAPNQRTEYMDKEVHKLAKNIKRMAVGDFGFDIDFAIEPPCKYTETEYKLFTIISNNLQHVFGSIKELTLDINKAIGYVTEGELTYRTETEGHHGEYKNITEGVNNLVEMFAKPLLFAMEFIHDIATGNKGIKRMEEEYKGDFNELKNSINNTFDALWLFTNTVEHIENEVRKNGNLDVEIDLTNTKGA